MKIKIIYHLTEGPYGGGNQFLKALKSYFIKAGAYEEDENKADVFLFNSHHELKKVFYLKKKFPQKIFVHRIDGPIQTYRGKDKTIDDFIFHINKLLADGVVFQSYWSRAQNRRLFSGFAQYETVIRNGPDAAIFNKQNKKCFNPEQKIKLIAASWSSNWKKGFDVYQFLDNNLDFKKYEMVFVGNAPVSFKNIRLIKPVPSDKLALLLKQSDIYITASQSDPCSNSLIEALSCGLPAVALNDGGHPELLKRGGELFSSKEDILKKIEKVAANYHNYQALLPCFFIEKIGQKYFDFFQKIFNDGLSGYYFPRQVGIQALASFYFKRFELFLNRALNKLSGLCRKKY